MGIGALPYILNPNGPESGDRLAMKRCSADYDRVAESNHGSA